MSQQTNPVSNLIRKRYIIGITSLLHKQRFLIAVIDMLVDVKLRVKRVLKVLLYHLTGTSVRVSR